MRLRAGLFLSGAFCLSLLVGCSENYSKSAPTKLDTKIKVEGGGDAKKMKKPGPGELPAPPAPPGKEQ